MQRNDLYRIIDANINRASEALRVLEDWARFGKDSKAISEKLKNIRHNLNKHFESFGLVANREAESDVGRNIENNSKRETVRDILRANSKRAEEALRVLSEYGQLLNVDTRIIEKDRYEVYTTEKELLNSEKLFRLANSSLYLVTNRDNFKSNNDFLNVIEKAIEGGVDIIQLREKKECESTILLLAKEIKKLIAKTEILFIVNDRIDIALACEADGVHLGQDDFPLNEARKILPEGFIIGLSTHSEEQGKNAVRSYGHMSLADYLGVGPVFPTPTKPDYKAAGLEYVNWANENLKNIPWFAIGGIDTTNIDKVISAGAGKIAVVRSIMEAGNPKEIAKTLKEKLSKKSKLVYEKI